MKPSILLNELVMYQDLNGEQKIGGLKMAQMQTNLENPILILGGKVYFPKIKSCSML